MSRGLAKGSVVQSERQRAAGRAYAREWRERNKPVFDAMDAQGMFSDSLHPRRLPA